MRRRNLLPLILLLPAVVSCAAPSSRDLMTFLTSLEIGGREAGTPEAARVADTLAALFARTGLRPAGTDGYFQPFLAEAPRIDSANTRVRFRLEGAEETEGTIEAILGKGLFFFPRHGRTQTIDAPVLFGGYGIVAPELGRQDYVPQEARGKLLVLFLGAPPDSAFLQGSAGFRYSLGPVKTRIAQENGALGVFFVQAEGDVGRLQKEVQSKAR
ncbi:MAG: hypothetical protein FJY66_06475, partial [Calditrichaeota bacterium]|nr:hypothetical protein [Calditrichota bacterium]